MPSQTIQPSLLRPVGSALLTLVVAALLLLAPLKETLAAGASNRQQAIQIAKQQSGGTSKVLSVDTVTRSDGTVEFAVKILSDGRIRVFRIPKSE